ncbi:putative Charged multivesicular body protein [Naja naja]|nr:putative Charged multivesicular body protein [Naja naja]
MGLFGKTPEKPPKELVNEWSLKIRKEMRVIDRQIRDIQREEEKVKRSIKDAAKKGQKDVCIVLAKEMIRSRKAVSKLYASRAHMNSVLMGMKNQLAVLRVAGSLQKSTEVMKAMQNLVKIPEIQATMRELSKEMMKVTDALPDQEPEGATAAVIDDEEEDIEAMQSRLATLRS